MQQNEISVILMGGLGNQIFQIYALISSALRQGSAFAFPVKIAGRRQRNYTKTFFHGLEPFFKDIHYPIGYNEPHYHYNPIPEIKAGTSLHGYFQSYRYFQDYLPVINAILQIDQQRSVVRHNSQNHYDGIAMHFRVGDYLEIQECHPVLTRSYYENALKFILKHEPEIQEVTYFYERGDEVHVVEIVNYLKLKFANLSFSPAPSNLEDYEELLTMSLYRHNIIANSSFSWWSAMYNDNPDKIVCFPDIWFGPKMADHDTKDLCPADWHRISS
jgi:hypothetical protein